MTRLHPLRGRFGGGSSDLWVSGFTPVRKDENTGLDGKPGGKGDRT